MHRRFVFLLLAALVPSTAWALPDEALVREVLAQRIEEGKAVGIVVGMIDAERSFVVGHGSLAADDPRVPDGDTVFEIGSVSKVFTTTLLADRVARGGVSLDDPAGKFLPEGIPMPSKDGREITLLHLATHSSGLYRMPNNLVPADPTNPFAAYAVDDLHAFLSSTRLFRDPGAQTQYSNLGMGLLGHVLALEAGKDYETLVRKRITGPLKMKDTGITLDAARKRRLAQGHDFALKPVPNWDFATLEGAGALRSTANDMLRFVAANLGLVETRLADALEATHASRMGFGADDTQIGLGWLIREWGGREVLFHNGQTGGYHSFVAFDKKNQIGVVVLSSCARSINDIGIGLLLHPEKLVETEQESAEAAR